MQLQQPSGMTTEYSLKPSLKLVWHDNRSEEAPKPKRSRFARSLTYKTKYCFFKKATMVDAQKHLATYRPLLNLLAIIFYFCNGWDVSLARPAPAPWMYCTRIISDQRKKRSGQIATCLVFADVSKYWLAVN